MSEYIDYRFQPLDNTGETQSNGSGNIFSFGCGREELNIQFKLIKNMCNLIEHYFY